MTLVVKPTHLEAIKRHGQADYPNECCGILLGESQNECKNLREVVPLKNLRHDARRAEKILPLDEPGRESERNRFLIDPLEQLHVEKDARTRKLDVLGYYHSHPDHPARPSQYDREHAWPWYSYVIVSVERGEPKHLTSWILSDDRSHFEEESIEVLNT